jgi:hypothetical protein
MDKRYTPDRPFNFQPSNFYSPNSNFSNNINNYDIKKFEVYDKNNIIYKITTKKVKEAFNLFAIDQKYLNKHAFDNALEFLFSKMQIPALHHTHLSDKLYNIFNLTGNLKLNESEFINCIKELLSKKNNRLHLSMMAMMKCPNKARNNVDLDELKTFFYESFVQGYKHLAWQINQKPDEFRNYGLPVASISQMEAWAREFEKKIKIGFDKDLKMFDPNINDNISFEQYKKWIHNDQTLYIKYGFKTLMIATSLIIFDNVTFED